MRTHWKMFFIRVLLELLFAFSHSKQILLTAEEPLLKITTWIQYFAIFSCTSSCPLILWFQIVSAATASHVCSEADLITGSSLDNINQGKEVETNSEKSQWEWLNIWKHRWNFTSFLLRQGKCPRSKQV